MRRAAPLPFVTYERRRVGQSESPTLRLRRQTASGRQHKTERQGMDERGRKAKQVRTQQQHRTADALPAPGATPHADVAPREPGAREAWLNARDPRTQALLTKRTSSGGYEVGEADLVRNIRHWQEHGE